MLPYTLTLYKILMSWSVYSELSGKPAVVANITRQCELPELRELEWWECKVQNHRRHRWTTWYEEYNKNIVQVLYRYMKSYESHIDKFNWLGLRFPMALSKFVNLNNRTRRCLLMYICINRLLLSTRKMRKLFSRTSHLHIVEHWCLNMILYRDICLCLTGVKLCWFVCVKKEI